MTGAGTVNRTDKRQSKTLSRNRCYRLFRWAIYRSSGASLGGEEITATATEKSMNRRRRFGTLLASGLAAVVLLAGTSLVSATSDTFGPSEGCDGTGVTYLNAAFEIGSNTTAELIGTTTPCHYSYLLGEYQPVGSSTWSPAGPGWAAGGWITIEVSPVQDARNVYHSGCSTNTPACPGADYAVTWY
jgi:hypothetical protein